MNELKPCPFCGGQAQHQENANTQTVYCYGCPATIKQQGSGLNSDFVIKAWNTRKAAE